MHYALPPTLMGHGMGLEVSLLCIDLVCIRTFAEEEKNLGIKNVEKLQFKLKLDQI